MYAVIALIVVVIGFFVWQYWKYKATDIGAPYVPLEPEVVDAVLRLAQVREDDVVYDLGSGDGRVAVMAALRYHARAVGIESDYLRYLYSFWQSFILGLRDKVKFIHGNFFNFNISKATVVTLFLLEETNESLIEKLLTELRPGTQIVSSAFQIPGWEPVATDDVHVTPYGPLYLYEVGTSNPQQS